MSSWFRVNNVDTYLPHKFHSKNSSNCRPQINQSKRNAATISCKNRILIFEWLSGGGLLIDNREPVDDSDLQLQGQQMLTELCTDFHCAGFEVIAPVDFRCDFTIAAERILVRDGDALQPMLVNQSRTSDWILVVAPESNGRLLQCLNWLKGCRKKWLNPSVLFTELTADKNRLQEYLLQRNIPVPRGEPAACWLEKPASSKPVAGISRAKHWVLKPSDGCGSERIQLFDAIAWQDLRIAVEDLDDPPKWRIEEFVSGIPVSVSVMMKRSESVFFPAVRQVFNEPPIGNFSCCANDLPTSIAERARNLARQTIDALPKSKGFVGIDMVIGSFDVVVEVNPRITMSYGVLRNELGCNLAGQMIESTLTAD